VVFLTILLLTLITSLKKLEYGLYILLAELFIGSKGYIFYFDFGGMSISLRIGLFLVILGVWVLRFFVSFRAKRSEVEKSHRSPYPQCEILQQARDSRFTNFKELFNRLKSDDNKIKIYSLLFIFIIFGFLWGIVRGNGFHNVFFDFNGWLYFALIFPIADAIKSREQIENIFQILTASVAAITIKTFFLLYIFSHQIEIAARPLYRWLRKFLIGEITLMDNGFHRIFFQSQIYVLIGFFIFLAIIIWSFKKDQLKIWFKKYWPLFFLTAGTFASILVSFSRSFWVGIIAGTIALFIVLIIFKISIKQFLRISLLGISIICCSLLFIWITIIFPFPKTDASFSFSSMFEDRLTDINEAAVRSRWDLLPPLGRAIVEHPIIGSGFGTTVTYKSSDPRALEISPTGEFTTYAFEWGYLDIMLKIGLAGLLVYLFLIWFILKGEWKLIKNADNNIQALNIGLFIGIIALLATNFFSPYLNHPLGIGYVMLCDVFYAYNFMHTTTI
jgi:O-antigen ligase